MKTNKEGPQLPDGVTGTGEDVSYTPAQAGYARPASPGGGSFARSNQAWMVLGAVAAAVAVLLVACGFFGLGYLTGRSGQGGKSPLPAAGGGRGLEQNTGQGLKGQEPGAPGERVERLKQALQKRGADLIEGTVESVDDKSVTLDTGSGKQTVGLTPDTKFPGSGGQAAGAGAQKLQAGEKVFVVVRKAADGKLEAVAVRTGKGAGQKQNMQNAPGSV